MKYSPLRYPGGKSKTYKLVEYLLTKNDCESYAEPYAGGAGVAIKLLINKKVKKIYLNDYDKSIYSFWYSVLNHTEELVQMIRSTPITIDEWYKQKSVQNDKINCTSLLQLGYSTLFLNRTNRSGILKAGVIGGKGQNGNYKLDCRFDKEKIIQRIEEIAKYKNKIVLTNKDAIDFIKQNLSKTKRTFIFLDPPYYVKGPTLYTNFYQHNDHFELANVIKYKLKSKYWILTYDNSPEIYEMYKEYKNNQYILNYSISKPTKGIEYIFFSNMLNEVGYENYINIYDLK
ncbi:MAG: DNA adenine methylase [Mammaliicoccus sciuri]